MDETKKIQERALKTMFSINIMHWLNNGRSYKTRTP